ncbi:MAG: L-serine ammonia-lyase, iron-sulfur-dependent, subunit alpha [Verrucomicrobia bacterium]|nr:L-serine ammonia-lyase, iron-sulfur-dependent, subunit alpha [Verrucomicrobiota bacterium]MBU1910047.1 L-serine ammonia-lyase, iron-sulfur-dependent, subunit alpha [Verrucomicrobiota bacterium]
MKQNGAKTDRPLPGSIFDLYKIGAGPSSSHSIGPERAARLFLERVPARPAGIRVTLFGSLAATGRGHLTDQSVRRALAGVPVEFVWDTQTGDLNHPNTMRFDALGPDGAVQDSWTVYSIGGGNLRDDDGPVGDGEPTPYPGGSLTELLAYGDTQGLAFWQLVERTEHDPWTRLESIWEVMEASVRRGLESRENFLPGSLKLARKARQTMTRGRDLASPQRDLALLAAFSLAVAEENAAGGTIVTAPSCGAAGVLPGLLYYYHTVKGIPRRDILEALATAGLFGSVIRANASISGAEVGCQGEIGSACSMAAAAGAQLLGGTLPQIEYAAEIAMEHHLGLTCDPVEGYVQIPCIERNMTACLRAAECAVFALLTDGRHLVSFDDVIDVMYRTGADLQSAYRETARGGLADLWRRRMTSKQGPSAAAVTPVPEDHHSYCD